MRTIALSQRERRVRTTMTVRPDDMRCVMMTVSSHEWPTVINTATAFSVPSNSGRYSSSAGFKRKYVHVESYRCRSVLHHVSE